MIDQELRDYIARLRDRMNAVKGDGFGHAGKTISAYKRTLKQLDDLLLHTEADIVDAGEEDEVPSANPSCIGRGSDNVLMCVCKVIYESIRKR